MQCDVFSLSTYIFVPEIPNNIDVGTGVANKLPLEEGNVDDGGVEVDELEDEDFEGEIIVEIWLSSVHLWKKKHENNNVPVFHRINSPHLVSRSARLSYTRPMAIMAIKFIWNGMRKIIMEILKSELQLKVHTSMKC